MAPPLPAIEGVEAERGSRATAAGEVVWEQARDDTDLAGRRHQTYHQRSLDHIFGLEDGTLPHGTYGLTVLPLDDDAAGVQGHCWAYVSQVDNVTGDPTNWW